MCVCVWHRSISNIFYSPFFLHLSVVFTCCCWFWYTCQLFLVARTTIITSALKKGLLGTLHHRRGDYKLQQKTVFQFLGHIHSSPPLSRIFSHSVHKNMNTNQENCRHVCMLFFCVLENRANLKDVGWK